MIVEPISREFIETRSPISWTEALWGYAHGHFGKDQLEKMIEIDRFGPEDEANNAGAGSALDKVRKLAALEPEQSSETIAKKWLYLVLAHLYEQRLDADTALAQIEIVYADFDYPKEIEGFVRYMPTTDGYDPARHTKEENLQRMMTKWKNYLSDSQPD